MFIKNLAYGIGTLGVGDAWCINIRVLSRIFSLGEKILKGMVGGGLQS